MGIDMKKLAFAFVLLAMIPVAGLAGEVADHAAAAEKALETGDGLAAIQEMDAAQDALWTAMPLTLRKIEKAVEASGLGVYTPRPDVPYKPGDSIYLYTWSRSAMRMATTGSATR